MSCVSARPHTQPRGFAAACCIQKTPQKPTTAPQQASGSHRFCRGYSGIASSFLVLTFTSSFIGSPVCTSNIISHHCAVNQGSICSTLSDSVTSACTALQLGAVDGETHQERMQRIRQESVPEPAALAGNIPAASSTAPAKGRSKHRTHRVSASQRSQPHEGADIPDSPGTRRKTLGKSSASPAARGAKAIRRKTRPGKRQRQALYQPQAGAGQHKH